MSKPCAVCGQPIEPLRAELAPEKETCKECGDAAVSDCVGFMDWSHKTAPELVIVSGSENIRRAARVNCRSR